MVAIFDWISYCPVIVLRLHFKWHVNKLETSQIKIHATLGENNLENSVNKLNIVQDPNNSRMCKISQIFERNVLLSIFNSNRITIFQRDSFALAVMTQSLQQ